MPRASIAIIIILVSGPFALGDIKSKAAREAAEVVLRKFGNKAIKEGAETLTRRIELMVARHGEEVLVAIRKTGPAALRSIEEGGPHGGAIANLLARRGEEAVWVVAQPKRTAIYLKHGDKAAEAMIRHKSLAEPLIETFGRPATQALNAVNGQNARRLAMMMEDGYLARLSKPRELMEVVGCYGDRAMDFVWKHKGALAVSTALVTFLADPKPFFDGAKDITKVAGEAAVKPLFQASGQAAFEAARTVNWDCLATLLLLIGGAFGLIRWRFRLTKKGGQLWSPTAKVCCAAGKRLNTLWRRSTQSPAAWIGKGTTSATVT